MLRRLTRYTFAAASVALISAVTPSTAAAQVSFQSCSNPGVCGWVQAMLSGTNLTVRLQNVDASFGSALYHASIKFANNLGTVPGAAFSVSPVASVSSGVNQIGTTFPNAAAGWSYDGVGGTNILDLSSFFGVYIEGTAPSPYRGSDGTFETTGNVWDSYVQFNADLSGVSGVNGNTITELGFDTDQGGASGIPTTATPEPGSILLVATGLAGLGIIVPRRRRNKR
jgi:hypothetical protein